MTAVAVSPRHAPPTSRTTGLLLVLASVLAAYLPTVAIVARDARMRDQLAADMHGEH